MKKILILSLVLGGSLMADTYNSDNNEKTYESSSGNKYKYDLSDPSDRLDYSVDPGGRRDDRINPSVGLDRSMGEYGGGIIDE